MHSFFWKQLLFGSWFSWACYLSMHSACCISLKEIAALINVILFIWFSRMQSVTDILGFSIKWKRFKSIKWKRLKWLEVKYLGQCYIMMSHPYAPLRFSRLKLQIITEALLHVEILGHSSHKSTALQPLVTPKEEKYMEKEWMVEQIRSPITSLFSED